MHGMSLPHKRAYLGRQQRKYFHHTTPPNRPKTHHLIMTTGLGNLPRPLPGGLHLPQRYEARVCARRRHGAVAVSVYIAPRWAVER